MEEPEFGSDGFPPLGFLPVDFGPLSVPVPALPHALQESTREVDFDSSHGQVSTSCVTVFVITIEEAESSEPAKVDGRLATAKATPIRNE